MSTPKLIGAPTRRSFAPTDACWSRSYSPGSLHSAQTPTATNSNDADRSSGKTSRRRASKSGVDRPGTLEPRLQGCRIDMPVEGLVTEDRGLQVLGWALGHYGQPRYVAFLSDERAPVRVMVDQQRPDIGARFPEVAAAATSGFRGSADLDRAVRTRLVVSAVWSDRVHTPLGAIYVERFWPDDPDPTIARLVSVVVFGSDELLIQSSLESARSQSHAPYELGL